MKEAGVRAESHRADRRGAQGSRGDDGVVAQIMGHAPNATAEKHYINRPLELLAVWHNKYEAWILAQAGVKFGKKQSRTKKVATKAPPRLRLVR